MTKPAQYPKGFQLGKRQSLYEETKGVASFRMYPDLTGKNIHIEVWTPNMARRKQKCVPKGSELSIVTHYYQIFVDYSLQNSTKTQLIYLASTPMVIEGEFNANLGVPIFDSKDRLAFDKAKMEKIKLETLKIHEVKNAPMKEAIEYQKELIKSLLDAIHSFDSQSNKKLLLQFQENQRTN